MCLRLRNKLSTAFPITWFNNNINNRDTYLQNKFSTLDSWSTFYWRHLCTLNLGRVVKCIIILLLSFFNFFLFSTFTLTGPKQPKPGNHPSCPFSPVDVPLQQTRQDSRQQRGLYRNISVLNFKIKVQKFSQDTSSFLSVERKWKQTLMKTLQFLFNAIF